VTIETSAPQTWHFKRFFS